MHSRPVCASSDRQGVVASLVLVTTQPHPPRPDGGQALAYRVSTTQLVPQSTLLMHSWCHSPRYSCTATAVGCRAGFDQLSCGFLPYRVFRARHFPFSAIGAGNGVTWGLRTAWQTTCDLQFLLPPARRLDDV